TRPADAPELESGIRQLLLSARRLLRAEYAELLILPADSRELPLRSYVGPHGEALMEPTTISAAEQVAVDSVRARGGLIVLGKDKGLDRLDPYTAERHLRDAIITTLEGENGLLGLLLVGDRAVDVSTFGHEDEKLFRTFARHAAVLLENEQLEHSLAKLTELQAKLRQDALQDALPR